MQGSVKKAHLAVGLRCYRCTTDLELSCIFLRIFNQNDTWRSLYKSIESPDRLKYRNLYHERDRSQSMLAVG